MEALLTEDDIVKEFVSKYPNFKDCSIQTFNDDKTSKDNTVARIMSVETGWLNKAMELNKKGAGVFFSVNCMNKGKRTQNDVTKINAWVVECDDCSKEEQLEMYKKGPIQPSILIASKKSLHAYFLAEDGTLDNRVKICMGLKEYYKGDVQVAKDIARVLRIPGFTHNKNKNEPFLVQYYEEPTWIKHKEKDMLESYPYTEVITNKKKAVRKLNPNDKYEYINGLDNEMVLNRLSNTELVNYETIDFRTNANGTKQIYCNGESTGCWILPDGFIGSKKGGGPTWKQWAHWYGKYDYKYITKWFLENCKDLIPANMFTKEHKKYIEIYGNELNTIEETAEYEIIDRSERIDIGMKELKERKNFVKFNIKALDDVFGGLFGGKIYTIGAETGTGKTTFTNYLLENIAEQGKKVVRIGLEDRIEDLAQEEIYYKLNRIRIKSLEKGYTWGEFIRGEINKTELDYYIKQIKEEASKNILDIMPKKSVTSTMVCKIIQEQAEKGIKLFVIDHLHYFKKTTSERYDLEIENTMHEINEVCRKYNAIIILIAHYRKLRNFGGKKEIPDNDCFKDAAAIKQVSNAIFHLVIDREKNDTRIVVGKYRGPVKLPLTFISKFDIKTYTFAKFTIEQQ